MCLRKEKNILQNIKNGLDSRAHYKELTEFFENYSEGKIFISCSIDEQRLVLELTKYVEMYAGVSSKDLILQELTSFNKYLNENNRI